jgi:cytochrome c553
LIFICPPARNDAEACDILPGSRFRRLVNMPMLRRLLPAALALSVLTATAGAQDTERGRKLFVTTAAATGKAVGNCVACHANVDALRGMLENRGGNPKDARFIRTVLQKSIEGAVPGARNAKAQYRGVLTNADLDDLAAYLARARAT